MTGDWLMWFWLLSGIVLVGSELFHTSLTTLFLGVAAIFVALLNGIGVVESLAMSVIVFAATSLGLAVPLRPLMRKYLPGETKYDPSDEDRNAYGNVVTVVETVFEGDETGRIRHQGTTWPATSLSGTIEAGRSARLVCREKLAWIVEVEPDAEVSSIEAET